MATYEDKAKAPRVHADELRSIQNARAEKLRGARAQEKTTEERQTVRESFIREKSVASQAKKREQKETVDESAKYARQLNKSFSQKNVSGARRKLAHLQSKGGGIKKLAGMSKFARLMGISVLVLIYFWQLMFGIISLIGFGIEAVAMTVTDNIVVKGFESVVNFVTSNVFNTTFSFLGLVPGDDIGYIFWGLSTILSVGIFVIYFAWFKVTGIDPLGTMASFGITVLCLVLSMLPVTNLFPWMILWVLYMNASTLFLRKTH